MIKEILEAIKLVINDIKKVIVGLAIFSCLILGYLIGGVVTLWVTNIVYISQTEILQLEKERIRDSGQELFLGKPEKAVALIAEIGSEREERLTRVLYSNESLVGKGVKSISKEVHAEIIKRMEAN